MFECVMAYPPYLRERARELRTEKRLSLDEIAERLALNKSTVWYWIKDLPLGRPRRENPWVGVGANVRKHRLLREAAYDQGAAEWLELVKRATFREFVALYIAEGSERCRNEVAIANSDERVIAMAAGWLSALTDRPLGYSIQYHADQDLAELRSYWGNALAIDGERIALQRKSNSGQMKHRTWRSRYGVMTVRVSDTYLRARLQAWMDRIRDDWDLNSAVRLGA
jgi:transcriptional regulator with XRE-family HTH domain